MPTSRWTKEVRTARSRRAAASSASRPARRTSYPAAVRTRTARPATSSSAICSAEQRDWSRETSGGSREPMAPRSGTSAGPAAMCFRDRIEESPASQQGPRHRPCALRSRPGGQADAMGAGKRHHVRHVRHPAGSGAPTNSRFVAFSLATRGTRRQILVDLATGRKTHLACTVVPCTALVVDDLSPSGRFVTLTTSSNAGPRHIVLYDAHTRTESARQRRCERSLRQRPQHRECRFRRRSISVVFTPSLSTNLIPGDTNNAWDVFRLDRETGAVTRVDLTAGGGQIPTGIGTAPDPPLPCQLNRSDQSRLELTVSRDGSVVTFASDDGSVVAGDTNSQCDVFARGDGL